MPLVDRRTGSVVLRIVYDGPPEAGKTTNLRHLCERLSLGRRGTGHRPGGGAWTPPFDGLDVTGGWVDGHRVRCQLVAVPGQIELARRRRHILDSADVVVFVADSRADAAPETSAALRSLARGLGARADVPLVLQANKQDLPDAQSPERLHEALGLAARVPVVGAQAAGGAGVLETFMLAVRLAVDHVRALLVAGELGESDAAGAAELLSALEADAPEVFDALDAIAHAVDATTEATTEGMTEATTEGMIEAMIEASQETTAAADATPDLATADTTAESAIDAAWDIEPPASSTAVTRPIRMMRLSPIDTERAIPEMPAAVTTAAAPGAATAAIFTMNGVEPLVSRNTVTRRIRAMRALPDDATGAAATDAPPRSGDPGATTAEPTLPRTTTLAPIELPALAPEPRIAAIQQTTPLAPESVEPELTTAAPAPRDPLPFFGTDDDPTWELEPVEPRTPAIVETRVEPSAPIAFDARASHTEIIAAADRDAASPLALDVPPPPDPLPFHLPPVELPSDMVWPSVSGRAALAVLGAPVRLAPRTAPWAPDHAIELECSDGWSAHTSADLVFPGLDHGRPALSDAIRWQAKLTDLSPPGRTYALAPEGDGVRLWVLTPAYRTVWTEIERAFEAGDRATAGRLARCGLAAVDELRLRGVPTFDLDHIAVDDPSRLLATPWTPDRDRLIVQLQRLFAAAVL